MPQASLFSIGLARLQRGFMALIFSCAEVEPGIHPIGEDGTIRAREVLELSRSRH